MKILLLGSSGMIGQRILAEALSRGHQVTTVMRDTFDTASPNDNPRKIAGDIFDPDSIARAAAGQDVIISAYGPGKQSPSRIVEATRSLVTAIQSVQSTNPIRLITIGGAGSLEVAPGQILLDSPGFPSEWKALAEAHRDALEILRNSDIDWSSLCPAAYIEPGQRTGRYRNGTDQLVIDKNGESRISAEDCAVAMVDEVENPRFSHQRFTAAY